MTFTKNDIIIQENDENYDKMKLFFLESGSVQVLVGAENHLVRTIHIGEYFGERAILNRVPRSATCLAASDQVKCLALDVAAFERLLGPLRSVLRGKSRSYVIDTASASDASTTGGGFIGTSTNKQSENASKKGPSSSTTGWFRVGNQVYRTNITSLNGKSFRSIEEYFKFIASLKTPKLVTPPSLSHKDEFSSLSGSSSGTPYFDDRQHKRKPYNYYVQGKEYPTQVEVLQGRTFATVEDFIAFFNRPHIVTTASPIHGADSSFQRTFDV